MLEKIAAKTRAGVECIELFCQRWRPAGVRSMRKPVIGRG